MPRIDSPFVYNSTYHSVFQQRAADIARTFDIPMIRRVFETSDVIGISHYAPLPYTGLSPGMFAMPIDTAAYELAHWGVDLRVRPGAAGGGRAGRVLAGASGRAWRAQIARLLGCRHPHQLDPPPSVPAGPLRSA